VINYLKKCLNKIFLKSFLVLIAVNFLLSCASNEDAKKLPSWYISPKQNDAANLYGVGTGRTLEEATKSALSDSAARLITSISSSSETIIEENKFDVNQELRQNIKQNIEKIEFSNFKVSQSSVVGFDFFVEVKIPRENFLQDQQNRLSSAEQQISNIDKNLTKLNPIQKKANLTKILELEKEVELAARILKGLSVQVNVEEKIKRQASFKNQLRNLANEIEFFIESSDSNEIAKVVKNSLTFEKIKIGNYKKNTDQISLKISSQVFSNEVYGSHISKVRININCFYENKLISGNSFEVSGSSVISKKESFNSAIESLKEKIASESLLKILNITN
jgi:hypothetical protein